MPSVSTTSNPDAEKVRLLLDDYCAGGLAVVGFSDTAMALEQGQVDDLSLRALHKKSLSLR